MMTKNEMLMELGIEELEQVGGSFDSSEAFDVYADYLNTLFEKYNVHGIREVKKVCTPEERAKIKELYHAFLNAPDVA